MGARSGAGSAAGAGSGLVAMPSFFISAEKSPRLGCRSTSRGWLGGGVLFLSSNHFHEGIDIFERIVVFFGQGR